MNYDNLNKIHEYWWQNLMPTFQHLFTVTSFDEYLKRFSFLPSGNWLRQYEKIKLTRTPFLIDSAKFAEKYKKYCVTYNSPMKSEDGIQRAIYQLSPTLHLEAGYWIWVENEEVQAYASVFCCYHDETEYADFIEELYEIRQEGDTEKDSKRPVGLAASFGFSNPAEKNLTNGGKQVE